MYAVMNTTAIPTAVLRKLAEWCRRQVGTPKAALGSVEFRTRRYGGPASGSAWAGRRRSRVIVRLCTTQVYPTETHARSRWPACADRWDALVFVTAHEFQHVSNFADGTHAAQAKARDLEPHCDRVGKRVLAAFTADRANLLATWGAVPTPAPEPVAEVAPPPAPEPDPAPPAVAALRPLVARRAAKAALMLARWERRLKLAKTKVAKLRRRVRYYDRKTPTEKPAC